MNISTARRINSRICSISSPTLRLPSSTTEDLTCPTLTFTKLNKNQLALGAAIEELSNWVGMRGSDDVAENVRGALDMIDRNTELIKMKLAVLTALE